MNITEFSVNEPDDDGDMSCSLNVEADNTTEHDVRFVRTQTVFANADGVVFASDASDHDTRVEPGESFALSIGAPWLPVRFCGDARDDITVRVYATMYRRDYVKLGEAAVPADERKTTVLSKAVHSEGLGAKVAAIVGRGRPDDDGDVQISVRCGVANQGQTRIDHVTLKAELIDDDDSVMNSSESSVAIEPGAESCVELAFWGVNKRTLKAARIRLGLAVFHAVLQDHAEGVSSAA